jgi:hypothetical protein
MPNRDCRDKLILTALDMALTPNLEIHDAPDGVVQPDAFSIAWLENIIDYWYHIVPFSTTITKVSLNATANGSTIILPADFIVDVRNGYLVQTVPNDALSYDRTRRVPLQKFITRQISFQRSINAVLFPYFYTVAQIDPTTKRQLLSITPTPTIATQGQLWYYALPARLGADDIPPFPAARIMVEYLFIRAREWSGIMPPGSAQGYCDKLLASCKAAGLLNEPEDDEIPMDGDVYRHGRDMTTYSWMGPR